MFINVRAHNPGHAGTFTPGRFWANGTTHRLEVVDDAIARQQAKPAKGMADDPALQALKVAEGPFLAEGAVDPARITRAGLDFIKANQHLSILADEESQGAITSATVDAARSEIARLNAELTDAKLYAAELEQEAAKLTERVAELEKSASGEKPKAKKVQDEKPEGEAK